jgi:prevent-host-death family protein
MPTYNVLEAKTNLSRLIEAVESGAEPEIIIARNGKPAARIVPLTPARKPVRLGRAAGVFEIPESIDRDNAIIERLFNGEAG